MSSNHMPIAIKLQERKAERPLGSKDTQSSGPHCKGLAQVSNGRVKGDVVMSPAKGVKT